MLSVERLTKRFGGLAANEDVSFEVGRGEIIGLIGPNGAGKTTVFNSLAGFFPPDLAWPLREIYARAITAMHPPAGVTIRVRGPSPAWAFAAEAFD